MTYSAEIRRRVESGAALLDIEFPGWVDKVNIATLDLESPCNCILGQSFGDYFKGAKELGVDNRDVVLELFGFVVNWTDDELEEDPDMDHVSPRVARLYAELDEAWSDLVQERRSAALLMQLEESVQENA